MDVAGGKRRRGGAAASAADAGGVAARDAPADDVDKVLIHVRSLAAKMRADAAAAGPVKTLADLGVLGVREVTERSPDEVMVRLYRLPTTLV